MEEIDSGETIVSLRWRAQEGLAWFGLAMLFDIGIVFFYERGLQAGGAAA